MSANSWYRELRAALVAYYPLETERLEQVIEENQDNYPQLKLVREIGNNASTYSASQRITAGDGAVGNYLSLDSGAPDLGAARSYLEFPKLGPEVLAATTSDTLPSISLFFRVPKTATPYQYNLLGSYLALETSGHITAVQHKKPDDKGGRVIVGLYSSVVLPYNQWNHVYWRLGDRQTQPLLYINGLLDREATEIRDYRCQGLLDSYTQIGGGFQPNEDAATYTIGRQTRLPGWPPCNDHYGIDEIMFFNKSLSAAAIEFLAARAFHPNNPSIPELSLSANFLSVDLACSILAISNSKTLDATYFHSDYSVELWFRYNQVIENSGSPEIGDDDAVYLIAQRTGAWALGVTGDGRLTSFVYWQDDQGNRHSRQITSEDEALSTDWNHVTLTVSYEGQICLFSESTQVASCSLLGNASAIWSDTSAVDYSLKDIGGPKFIIGSLDFVGHFHSLTVHYRALDAQKIAKSMYLADYTVLPESAMVHVHIHHGSNPDGILGKAPLRIMLRTEKPWMLKHQMQYATERVQFAMSEDVGISSWTGATRFDRNAFVECGTTVFRNHQPGPLTFEGWFFFAGSQESVSEQDKFTVFSSGAAATPAFLQLCVCYEAKPRPAFRLCIFTAAFDYNPGRYGNAHPWKKMFWKTTLEGEIEPGKWYHFAISMAVDPAHPSQMDKGVVWWRPTIYVNSIQRRPVPDVLFFVPSYVFSYDCKLGDEMEMPPRPFNIGGVFYAESNDDLWNTNWPRKLPPRMVDKWNGCICNIRIWNFEMGRDAVLQRYDWAYDVMDLGQLVADWSLDGPHPRDLAGNNTCHLSAYAHVTTVPLRISIGDTDEPKPPNYISYPKPGSTRKRATASKEVVLISEILSLAVEAIAPVRADFEKLANVIDTAYHIAEVASTFNNQIQEVQTIVNKTEVTEQLRLSQIASFTLRMLKTIYKRGLAMKTLRTFSFSKFGLLRFLNKLVPYEGQVFLLLELITVALEIVVAVQRYNQTPAIEQASKLSISPRPDLLYIKELVAGGDPVRFTLTMNPPLRRNQSSTTIQDMNTTVRLLCDQALQEDPVLHFDESITFEPGGESTKTLTVYPLRPSTRPATLSFEGDVLEPLNFSVTQHAVKIVPRETLLYPVQTGDSWIFMANFTVQYSGLLQPGDQVIWTPNTRQGLLRFTPNTLVFEVPKGEKESLKRKQAPLMLETTTKMTKPTGDFEETLEGDAELHSSTGKVAKFKSAPAAAKTTSKEETIYIYSINAGSGDCFNFWIDYRTKTKNSTGEEQWTTESANAIIDGGFGYAMKNLFNMAVHGPRAKEHIDLVIATHFDQDHVSGLQFLYRDMGATAYNAVDKKPKSPLMTWTPDNTRPSPRKRNGPQPPPPMSGGDVVIAEVQTTDGKRNLAMINEVLEYCKRYGWPYVLGPTQLTSPGQKTHDLLKVQVEYLAPDLAAVDYMKNNALDASVPANRASIVNTVNTTLWKPQFTSLWTGDAEESYNTKNGQTFKGLSKALGLLSEDQTRHFTFYKVSHHGSIFSNSESFFRHVTADHYILSGNGKNKNPGIACIQWILSGHHYRSEQILAFNLALKAEHAAAVAAHKPPPRGLDLLKPALDPPTLWITNPWLKLAQRRELSSFNRHGGTIYQRTGTSRKTETGWLRWIIVNGEVAIEPAKGTAETNVVEFLDDTPEAADRR